MSKHTPGPWHSGGHSVYFDSTHESSYGCDLWFVDPEIGQANARLIAAAPELLEALKSMTNFPDDFFDRRDDEPVVITVLGSHLKEARAAIAKAEAA